MQGGRSETRRSANCCSLLLAVVLSGASCDPSLNDAHDTQPGGDSFRCPVNTVPCGNGCMPMPAVCCDDGSRRTSSYCSNDASAGCFAQAMTSVWWLACSTRKPPSRSTMRAGGRHDQCQ